MDGLAKATIFMDLDAYGKLDMSLKAVALVSTEVGPSGPENSVAEASIEGCVGLSAGFDVKAGIDGALGPFFHGTADFDIFNLEKDIFKVSNFGGNS